MKISIFSLLLIMFCLPVSAQRIVLSDTLKKYDVDYPYYLEDKDASLNFESVVSKTFVKAEDKVPDFLGNLSDAIWYRFNISNKTNETQWFLEVKAGFMHNISIYQINKDGSVKSLTLNVNNHSKHKSVASNNLIFPITILKNSEKTIFIRSTSKTLIRTSMSIGTMQKLYEDKTFTSFGDGFFTAIAVALLLYNLFVYFMLREKVYLHYIGYISMAILHNNLVAGYIQAALPFPDWINTTTVLPVMCFFSILFTNSFLQSKEYAPLIYKLRLPLLLICIIPLICYVLGWYRIAILQSATLIFMLCIYWVIAGIIAYRNGLAPAAFYLGGYGILVVVSIVYELKMKGLLPENYWTDSSLFIGVAIESVILSFALANKFNFYKKEKERLQNEAYQQATRFSRELISMQEAERKRIASELHDSLGQKLVLIKNKILRTSLSETKETQQLSEDTLSQNVADAIQEIRNISYGLRPYQLDLLGLTSSIKSMAEDSFDTTKIDYSIDSQNIDSFFDNEAQINIYRIIQECIHNIIKHADAKNVDIIIKKINNQIKITITDDGIGFSSDENKTGFGLKGIKERLQILDGTMKIDSNFNKGSLFEFLIPLQ